jgi:hypothetical protein
MKKRQSSKYPGFLHNNGKRVTRMHHLVFGKPDTREEILGSIENYKELYELLYDSSTNTPHGFTKQETRIFGRVLTKLESIGVVSKRTTNSKSFDLGSDGGIASFEDTEFDILMTALNEVAWQARYTRKADSLYEWLESAPKELPKPQLVKDDTPAEVGAQT